jgi:ASCH domain
VKALSLRQPWAWAILHAGKRIENRRWNTKYRGPVLLHAAKGGDEAEFRDAFCWMVDAGVLPISSVPSRSMALGLMPRGGIVGRARIVDVIRPWCPELRVGGEPPGAPPFRSTLAKFYPAGVDHRWHIPDQFGFVLSEVEPLPFVPLNGMFGLFDVDESLIEGAA